MKGATLVVLLAILSVAWAADADVEEVATDFTSAPGMTTARVVQNVKVFLNPDNVVKATIVAHLPSHDYEEEEEQTLGNAFETSNFEANEVIEEDAESLESTAVEAVEVESRASSPIRQLKADLVRVTAMTSVPDMVLNPIGTPSDANAPVVPLGSSVAPAPPQVMDEAAIRASHLYIGHEPAGLPTGLEIKRPVDTSGSVGTEAGTDFDHSGKWAKKHPKGAKCGNGCQLKVPVMVGYVGIKEQPASGTREVRMPGDRQRWRNIHQDLKTTDKITWRQSDLNAGRKHLKRAARKIDNMRRGRKLYEDTALNRDVVVPIRA